MKIKFMLLPIIIILSTFYTAVFALNGTLYSASSKQEIENIIFNAIKNREEVFQIRYTGNTDQIMGDVKAARDAAVEKDTYHEGCISLISGFKISKFSDHADISFDGFKYYTTREQEEYVDSEIQSITSKIIKSQMSDSQKEKSIHDYIIDHISYDSSLEGYTAYSAIHNGKTVCNGYAQVAYKLLCAAGIETRIVKGTSGGKDHEWNLVKINGNWYHLDCTLDDTISSKNGTISYEYYNLSDTKIRKDHDFDSSKYPKAGAEFAFETNSDSATNISGGGGVIPAVNGVKEFYEIKKYANIEQPKNKVWRLKFNQEIDLSTVTTENISIIDSSGAPIADFKVSMESNYTIVVTPPESGYKDGEAYTIYIKELKSSLKNSLKKIIKIPFKVKG